MSVHLVITISSYNQRSAMPPSFDLLSRPRLSQSCSECRRLKVCPVQIFLRHQTDRDAATGTS